MSWPKSRLAAVGLLGVYSRWMLSPWPTRDPVVWQRQVLGGQPEVDGVLRDVSQRPFRRELGLDRLLAAEHLRLRLADHLDVAHRIVEVRAAEVEVVDPEGLLEDGRVRVLRQGEHRLAVVVHEVAADLIGAVGQAVRVLVAGRGEQQLGGVRGAARDDHDVALIPLGLAVPLDDHGGDGGAVRAGFQLHRPARSAAASRWGIPARDGRRSPRRRTWRAAGTGSRRSPCSARRCCRPGSPRRAGCRTARGTDGSPTSPGHRRAAGCAARARPRDTGTVRWPAAPSRSSPRTPCTW